MLPTKWWKEKSIHISPRDSRLLVAMHQSPELLVLLQGDEGEDGVGTVERLLVESSISDGNPTYPRRTNDGTQPRNIHDKPSFFVMSVRRCRIPREPCEVMIRVFITSTGEHMVVATSPLSKLAVKWVTRPSSKKEVFRSCALNWS
jgi:hypothetical protein